MPRYTYTAQASTGERITAVTSARSIPALAARLAAEGAQVRTVREVREAVPRIRGVPYLEVIGIYRQIGSSIETGLPLVEALEMMSVESRNTRLRSLLYFLKTQVAEGVPLSDAMRSFPNIFPAVHIAIVRSGEESGRLGQAISDLAESAETLSNMNRRFASMLVYPTVIAIAALGLLNFGFFAIVPKFKALFGDLGIVEYPMFTQMVFFIAKWIAPATVLAVLGVSVAVGMILTQRAATSGRLWLDSWKLRLPAIGQVVEKAALARFSGTLGLLLDAGIDLPAAMRMAAEGAGNKTVERLLKNVSTEVELGRTLSESIDKTGAMPTALAWRIGVGEETGTLPDALTRMSRLYAKQVDNLVTSLAGLLEPILIITIGSAVAMLVLGMFLPLVAVIQNLSGVG